MRHTGEKNLAKSVGCGPTTASVPSVQYADRLVTQPVTMVASNVPIVVQGPQVLYVHLTHAQPVILVTTLRLKLPERKFHRMAWLDHLGKFAFVRLRRNNGVLKRNKNMSSTNNSPATITKKWTGDYIFDLITRTIVLGGWIVAICMIIQWIIKK